MKEKKVSKTQRKNTSTILYGNVSSLVKEERLAFYLAESEGAKFWLQVLSYVQARGLKDIFIACTDSLQGFLEAVLSMLPKTEIQSCIVHPIRN